MSSLILTGPSPPDTISGAIQIPINEPSQPFTVTPNQEFTGQVVMTDQSLDPFNLASGIFNPQVLNFSNSVESQTFTYTGISMGYKLLSISAAGATVSGPIYVFINSPGYSP